MPRRFQFSLKTIFAVALLVAVAIFLGRAASSEEMLLLSCLLTELSAACLGAAAGACFSRACKGAAIGAMLPLPFVLLVLCLPFD